MQFPESWLRTFVNPGLSTEDLSHRLTMAGLEVEDVQPVAPAFNGIVAARIESVKPHPNADKLRVCRVDDGSGQQLQIVCGAPNALAGMVVPLARVGAKLPDGMEIRIAKMRGVESFGMLCSARELGISQDHAGLMPLDHGIAVGTDVRKALKLDDSLFTLKLTPNRADCLSIMGVAREVSALTDTPVKAPLYEPVPVTINDKLPVKVDAADLCGRFGGRIIKGVNSKATTPSWMVERLERAGQRSVSVLVDISNYVMIELGRPTHVFDLDKIHGKSLEVRWGKQGEKLKLLNGLVIDLDPSMGVIASNGIPESLAGIMGGDVTAVSDDTTNIYLEGAFWWPDAIAGRARKLKLTSEASHRFERGVDFEHVIEHLEYISKLILDICGGQAGPVDLQTFRVPARQAVKLRANRCQKVLGIQISADTIRSVFDRLHFKHELVDGVFTVLAPSYRFDINIEEDLIEEVARIVGFENIPDHPPIAQARMSTHKEASRSGHQLREIMVGMDYQEVINYSFVDEDWEHQLMGNPDPIRLVNPISSQLAVMRSSLLPGLVANIQFNANRKQSRVRVFELGRVFARDAAQKDADLVVAGVHQPQYLSAAAWGYVNEEQWAEKPAVVDFYDVKQDLMSLFPGSADNISFVPAAHRLFHPGRCASIQMAGNTIGWIGELHPEWVQKFDLNQAPVMFEVELSALALAEMPVVGDISKQPVVTRDLALWVPADLPVQMLVDSMWAQIKAEPALSVVRQIRLFDVWKDPSSSDQSEKSLAFRFWLQDTDQTLEDARVDACMASIKSTLAAKHHARQR